jgi:hypothetical protein
LISASFHGNGGPAILIGRVINVCEKEVVSRQMNTGIHRVSDIACVGCDALLGWKYVDTDEIEQKYKIDKYLLDVSKIVKKSVVRAHKQTAMHESSIAILETSEDVRAAPDEEMNHHAQIPED